MCIGYFINDDPNRLVVKYGLDPNNTNRRQDCKKRTFCIEADQQRHKNTCRACKDKYVQDMVAY